MAHLIAYRRLQKCDIDAHKKGNLGFSRFEHYDGTMEALKVRYAEMIDHNHELLAAELWDDTGKVYARLDRLVELTGTNLCDGPQGRLDAKCQVADEVLFPDALDALVAD